VPMNVPRRNRTTKLSRMTPLAFNFISAPLRNWRVDNFIPRQLFFRGLVQQEYNLTLGKEKESTSKFSMLKHQSRRDEIFIDSRLPKRFPELRRSGILL
jgi:hypothetical protein